MSTLTAETTTGNGKRKTPGLQRPRIDSLTPGNAVVLAFRGEKRYALFIGIRGEGADRKARFVSVAVVGGESVGTYEWEAYRHKDQWVYGSSADRVRIDTVLPSLDDE